MSEEYGTFGACVKALHELLDNIESEEAEQKARRLEQEEAILKISYLPEEGPKIKVRDFVQWTEFAPVGYPNPEATWLCVAQVHPYYELIDSLGNKYHPSRHEFELEES